MIKQVKKPSLVLHREKALGWLVYFHDRSDLVSHVMSLCLGVCPSFLTQGSPPHPKHNTLKRSADAVTVITHT